MNAIKEEKRNRFLERSEGVVWEEKYGSRRERSDNKKE